MPQRKSEEETEGKTRKRDAIDTFRCNEKGKVGG